MTAQHFITCVYPVHPAICSLRSCVWPLHPFQSVPAYCISLQGQHLHNCYPAAQAATDAILWPALHSEAFISMKYLPSRRLLSQKIRVFLLVIGVARSHPSPPNIKIKGWSLTFLLSICEQKLPSPNSISNISVLLYFASRLAVRLSIFLYLSINLELLFHFSNWICSICSLRCSSFFIQLIRIFCLLYM